MLPSLRRYLFLCLAWALIVLSAPAGAAPPLRLFVFASADMRALALEKYLGSQLPGVEVTVFGRIRGFQAALAERPDGVIARSVVLESFGLEPELKGYNGSSPTEPYVLASVGKPVTPSQLAGKTLGVVDILGRHKMDEFVGLLLDGVEPRLKHVTHERDLLALLHFDTADAVVTSERWVKVLSEKTEMNLKTTPIRRQVGLVAVAFPNPGAKGVLMNGVKSAGSGFNRALGVTQWR